MLTWPPSSDGGIHPYVASVVRRGNPCSRGLRRQTGGIGSQHPHDSSAPRSYDRGHVATKKALGLPRAFENLCLQSAGRRHSAIATL